MLQFCLFIQDKNQTHLLSKSQEEILKAETDFFSSLNRQRRKETLSE